MTLLKSWSAMTAQWASLIKPDMVVLHQRVPIRAAAVDLSWCYLRKSYITWGPDSPGHAWMYGADSRAGCHPSGLINEELGPVFNVFNMGRWRGRHTDGTHPSLWLMKSPAALSLSLFNRYSKIETHTRSENHTFLHLPLHKTSREFSTLRRVCGIYWIQLNTVSDVRYLVYKKITPRDIRDASLFSSRQFPGEKSEMKQVWTLNKKNLAPDKAPPEFLVIKSS